MLLCACGGAPAETSEQVAAPQATGPTTTPHVLVPSTAPASEPLASSDIPDGLPDVGSDTACEAAAVGYTDAEAVALINADRAALGADQQRRTIYVSLAHLAEGRSDCELNRFRYGIGKLVNMMSWAGDIVATEFIDPHDSVARVDTGELKWRDDAVPYLLAASGHQEYGVLADASGPAFRADWLSEHLTKPSVYGYIMHNPPTEQTIAAEFGVDPFAQGKFAGVSESIVTLHPRIIERQDADNGACWITHDFLHRPQAAAAMETGELPQGDLRFAAQQYIAREYICELPNGMHSYHLTGFVSQRRWDGNTCVAQNRSRQDKLVLNGQCFSCHTHGLNAFEDEVRGDKSDPSAYILANFPERDEMRAIFDADQARFDAAAAKIPYFDPDFISADPLSSLMSIYSERASDDLMKSPAGAFGAILPDGATGGPFWEDAVNPLATVAVDVGVLLPAEIVFEDLPETIIPGLQDKYREVGLDPNMNCQ